MQNKTLVLPVSGGMRPSHSKKLEWALRDFITSTDGSYYDDELHKGILTQYYKLDNGICIEQRIQIRESDYICITTLDRVLPSVCEEFFYQKAVNSINLELDYGNFEIDGKTGDIRYRTYYEPDGTVSMDKLYKLLNYPRKMINKYGHKFLELLENDKMNNKYCEWTELDTNENMWPF